MRITVIGYFRNKLTFDKKIFSVYKKNCIKRGDYANFWGHIRERTQIPADFLLLVSPTKNFILPEIHSGSDNFSIFSVFFSKIKISE